MGVLVQEKETVLAYKKQGRLCSGETFFIRTDALAFQRLLVLDRLKQQQDF